MSARTVSAAAAAALAGLVLSAGTSAPAEAHGNHRPARDRLPNLVPLPSSELQLGDAGPVFPSASQPSIGVGGCRLDEMAEEGARRCLRFQTAVANLGAGPIELRYRQTSIDPGARTVQRIYRGDGSHRERLAGRSELHPIHGHYHYTGFSISRLWRATSRGKVIGVRPARSGQKNGFCFEDSTRVGAGGEPRYNCLDYERDAGGIVRVTGISVGYADVYTANLNGQYVEISGVPDGYYVLTTTIDPDRTLAETSRRDNTSRRLLHLCGETVSAVRPGPPAPC